MIEDNLFNIIAAIVFSGILLYFAFAVQKSVVLFDEENKKLEKSK